MGLSEREQQLLDEMERGLYQSEADVMQTAPSHAQLNLRSLVLGILVLLVGVGALVAGVGLQQLWLGLVGFAVMLGGALLAFSKRDGGEGPDVRGVPLGDERNQSSRESFADRMNKRWEERMDGER